MQKTEALEIYLKHRPQTSTESDDFMAGWDAAIESAANEVYDFIDERSYLRAQDVLRNKLL